MAGPKGLTERGREMRRLLAAQRRSGLSLVDFARQRGLRANTLSWWRHRLRGGDGDSECASAGPFIEVSPVRKVEAAQAGVFEVVLEDGKVVRVPERFEEGALRRLLAVLQRC
jgi:hypothetical protein